MRAFFALLVLSCSCASDSAFKRADCLRYRYPEVNLLVCSDQAVGEHRRRVCKASDTGGPVDYLPRACFEPNRWGRKPVMAIGKSFMGCVFHEACHLKYPQDPAMCAHKFPCVEDVR